MGIAYQVESGAVPPGAEPRRGPSGRQLLTVNVIVGLTVKPDDGYGSIVQEYGPVDDHMHPKSGSRASSQISFWGHIAEK